MNAGVRGTANAVCDAPNKVIGRFEERQMASIAELNDKPFIPNILNRCPKEVQFKNIPYRGAETAIIFN